MEYNTTWAHGTSLYILEVRPCGQTVLLEHDRTSHLGVSMEYSELIALKERDVETEADRAESSVCLSFLDVILAVLDRAFVCVPAAIVSFAPSPPVPQSDACAVFAFCPPVHDLPERGVTSCF